MFILPVLHLILFFKAACKEILNAPDAVSGLAKGAAVFYNGIKYETTKCFDIYKLFIECADPTGCGLDNDAKAWDYQVFAIHI